MGADNDYTVISGGRTVDSHNLMNLRSMYTKRKESGRTDNGILPPPVRKFIDGNLVLETLRGILRGDL